MFSDNTICYKTEQFTCHRTYCYKVSINVIRALHAFDRSEHHPRVVNCRRVGLVNEWKRGNRKQGHRWGRGRDTKGAYMQ